MDRDSSEQDGGRRALVEAFGYALAWAGEDEVTCVLRRGHERWLGHGATRAAAFDDALAAALPSRLGAELLREALASRAGDQVGAERVLVPPPDEEPLVGEQAAAVTLAEHPAPPPIGEEAAEAETKEEGETGDGRGDWEVASAPGLGGLAQRPVLALPRIVAPTPALAGWEGVPARPAAGEGALLTVSDEASRPDPGEAHERLDRILLAIEQSLPDLATSTAARKRLQFTAWMAEARGLEQALPGQREVGARVAELAKRLGRLSKRWWPGTVSALFLRSTPSQVAEEILRQPCSDWLALSARLEGVLTAEEPRDADGVAIDWQDDAALFPQPIDAPAQLAEARATIARLLGSLDEDPPDWFAFRVGIDFAPEQEAELVRAAQRLRWLRESDVDHEAWACACGRLRWLCHHRGDKESALAKTLSRAHRPPRSWAAELGQDPEEKRRRKRLRELFRARPGKDTRSDELVAWLREALALGGDSLSPRRLAALLQQHRDWVLGLDEERLGISDRPARRRWRKLHGELAELDEAAAADERAELEAQFASDDAFAEDPPLERAGESVPGASLGAELARLLRPRLEGRRALFVSNRKDAGVCAELSALLGLEVDGAVASPRRTASACEQIAGGGYDFVLAATGFIGHSTDGALLAACRKSGATYVRTYKARPLSVLRALVRDCGVEAEAVVNGG